jgi:DNA-binding MarR family transcriptional regulator
MATACNCLALRQATRRVTQLYDLALAPLGLRATQYSLLNQVAQLGPVALNPLAEALVMDRAPLGHNLRPLEARGLLRIAVGQDRRSRDIALTPAGRIVLADARAAWRRAQRSFEAALGQGRAAALRTLLDRVAGAEFPPQPGTRARRIAAS